MPQLPGVPRQANAVDLDLEVAENTDLDRSHRGPVIGIHQRRALVRSASAFCIPRPEAGRRIAMGSTLAIDTRWRIEQICEAATRAG
jgi:hypothetical protein